MPSLSSPNESRLGHPNYGMKPSDASTALFPNEELDQVDGTMAPTFGSVNHSSENNLNYKETIGRSSSQEPNATLFDSADFTMADNLRHRGVHVIGRSLPNRISFGKLYGAFDDVLDAIESNPHLLRDMNERIGAWQRIGDNRRYFGGTPPAIRDRSARTDKEDKVYLQYIAPFYESALFREAKIARLSSMIQLHEGLSELHAIAAGLFSRSFHALEATHPGITKSVEGDGRFPAIVLKVIRYPVMPKRFAEDNAHYDKSALTLILNSDDKDTLVRVAPYSATGTSRDSFSKAVNYPASELEPNDATLIAGLCLQEVGFLNLPPTPHYILPIEEPRARHSVVAFHLIPGMDTEHLSTKVPFLENGSTEVVVRRA